MMEWGAPACVRRNLIKCFRNKYRWKLKGTKNVNVSAYKAYFSTKRMLIAVSGWKVVVSVPKKGIHPHVIIID